MAPRAADAEVCNKVWALWEFSPSSQTFGSASLPDPPWVLRSLGFDARWIDVHCGSVWHVCDHHYVSTDANFIADGDRALEPRQPDK
jgi:hypothetical protein